MEFESSFDDVVTGQHGERWTAVLAAGWWVQHLLVVTPPACRDIMTEVGRAVIDGGDSARGVVDAVDAAIRAVVDDPSQVTGVQADTVELAGDEDEPGVVLTWGEYSQWCSLLQRAAQLEPGWQLQSPVGSHVSIWGVLQEWTSLPGRYVNAHTQVGVGSMAAVNLSTYAATLVLLADIVTAHCGGGTVAVIEQEREVITALQLGLLEGLDCVDFFRLTVHADQIANGDTSPGSEVVALLDLVQEMVGEVVPAGRDGTGDSVAEDADEEWTVMLRSFTLPVTVGGAVVLDVRAMGSGGVDVAAVFAAADEVAVRVDDCDEDTGGLVLHLNPGHEYSHDSGCAEVMVCPQCDYPLLRYWLDAPRVSLRVSVTHDSDDAFGMSASLPATWIVNPNFGELVRTAAAAVEHHPRYGSDPDAK